MTDTTTSTETRAETGRGRNRTARKSDQRVITDLHLSGYTTEMIIDYFRREYGRELSPQMIEADWKAVRRQWAREVIDDLTPYMNEQIAAVRSALNHAWDRYREATDNLENGIAEVSRKQLFAEQRYWFDKVSETRKELAVLLQLNRGGGVSISIDNRQQTVQLPATNEPVKGYISVSPDDWPEPGGLLPATVSEGLYEEYTE